MEIIFLFALIITLALLISYSYFYGISPTPTSYKVQKELLEILPLGLEGNVAELGSGWGTLASALARQLPLCRISAYEISPIPYLFSKGIAAIWKQENLEIIRQDFFLISFYEYTLIVCYLYPGAMERLKEKFQKELKPGAYVISHTFAIPGWKVLHQVNVNDLYRTPIYLYRFPESSGCKST